LRERSFSRRRLSPLAVTRDVAETKFRGTKRHLVSAPPRGSVCHRPPEAIEGSFRQTDSGEISPSFVRCCPRFLHLLPFQPACVHPRAGCRRQISRLRRWVSLRPRRLDWRGGNRWRLRRVHCRAPFGRTRWTGRGQRRRERWGWFFCRIQRERRPQGKLTGGQDKPRQGMGQCQDCASARRDDVFSNGIRDRLKLARQPRGQKNASLPHERTPNPLVSFVAD
jgi:hypothetical protein